MNKNIKFDYDNGVSSCTMVVDGKTFTAYARCHPEDNDMKNQNTGFEIAFRRVSLLIYKARRDELKARLGALNQLYYSMKHSKKFNQKSYENIMLQRQIQITSDDLTTIKEMIAITKQNLKEYIDKKDEFYKAIRANRAKKANNN